MGNHASFLIKMQHEQGVSELQKQRPEGRLSLEGTTQALAGCPWVSAPRGQLTLPARDTQGPTPPI